MPVIWDRLFQKCLFTILNESKFITGPRHAHLFGLPKEIFRLPKEPA
jgi:hypothetical protein